MVSGILNVNKPIGISSFAVVRAVRRLVGVDPVGHGGTLDPAADGVLPVLVGRATRTADFVHEWPKTYVATVQLGSTSDTYDREGTIMAGGDASHITEWDLSAVLPAFTGAIAQVPPMHSALKLGGERLYRKARRGEVVERAPRTVQIDHLRLLAFDAVQAQCHLEVRGGKGVYVRSLAHDIGARLRCGAYLFALTRTAFGPLHIEDAVDLRRLEEDPSRWQRSLLPMDLPLREWPALVVEEARARAVQQGQSIAVPEAGAFGRHRLVDRDGRLLAWGVVDATRRLQPRAVFPP